MFFFFRFFLDFQEPDDVSFAFHAFNDLTCTFLRKQDHKLNTPSRILYIHIFKHVFLERTVVVISQAV